MTQRAKPNSLAADSNRARLFGMDVGLRMLVPRRLSRRRGENLHEKVMAFFLARES